MDHDGIYIGSPIIVSDNDSILVTVDCLTRSGHFITVKDWYATEKLAHLYISKIISLFGAPISISSNRGYLFYSNFLKTLQHGLGTRLNLSTSFYPQIDRQSKRTI